MNWNSVKVLVTGADGFIGSHLVEELVRKGANVRALSQYNSFNSWGWLETIDCLSSVEVVSGDIRDPFFTNDLTRDIDIVFHLAALIAIPYSYIAPKMYIDTNVNGTLNICNAVQRNGCKKMIHTSTSEVYGTARYVPIDEKHPLQPQSPYSASKIGADSIALSYFSSYDLPVVVARPFNTYGPRQSLRAVIPNIIAQMLAGAKSIKLGDVTPTRDFNFVLDTCGGLIALAESDSTIGEVVNIGSGHEISVKDLFSLLNELTSCSATITTDDTRVRPPKSEVFRLCCDSSKIKSLTGFTPRYTLTEGLKQTIDWFAQPDNLKRFKTNIYNV